MKSHCYIQLIQQQKRLCRLSSILRWFFTTVSPIARLLASAWDSGWAQNVRGISTRGQIPLAAHNSQNSRSYWSHKRRKTESHQQKLSWNRAIFDFPSHSELLVSCHLVQMKGLTDVPNSASASRLNSQEMPAQKEATFCPKT